MDRLEEKRKIKAQAFHERKVGGHFLPAYLRALIELVASSLRPSSCVKRLSQTALHRLKSSRSWDTRWGKDIMTCHQHYTTAIRYAPDARKIVLPCILTYCPRFYAIFTGHVLPMNRSKLFCLSVI